ncbi:uncharacterized protein LOC101456357 [Ceratitis capitata]|uniref:uncharacterized protein LOC101456357 n=1 Tax=Ceratitis capitata TaxID=7213 RepID=UPI000329F50B|nr:uncharacterized protein LOC101456357 [Ceratitis capitata]
MDSGVEEVLHQIQDNFDGNKIQRKRRRSENDDQENSSNPSTSDNGATPDYVPVAKFRGIDEIDKISIEDFPDEILYEIFKHLDSWSYYSLMNCCNRFHTLLMDRRFWQHIDLSQKLLPLGILEYVMERTHPGTTCLKLQGPSRQYTNTEILKFNKTLADTFTLRSTQLSVLELRGVTVDLKNVRIANFPRTLKRLVLRDCNICKPEEEQSIFAGIHTHLVNLEELGIEFSDWFEPYYIMMISKMPLLRWLSLKGCPRLGDFIPYGSMAARFGFKKLAYLDLRYTPITDSDIQCFNVVLTLKELLLDCPLASRDTENKNASAKQTINKCATNEDDCQPSTSRANTSNDDSPSSSGSDDVQPLEIRDDSDLEQPSCSSPQLTLSSSNTSSSSVSPFASPSHLPQDQAADNNPPEPAGNVPSRSRFLPRPDQVILLDFVSRRPSVRHVRPPPNLDNHFDQMLHHPLFWNIINPLERESRWSRSLTGPGHHPCYRQYPISDRGICCFGRPQNPVEQGVIWIRIGNRPSENSFERLSVRNYKKVTDISLHHLVQCSPDLIYLDLSGTSVTREGVKRFKAEKPECQIIADHLIGTSNDNCSTNQDTTTD